MRGAWCFHLISWIHRCFGFKKSAFVSRSVRWFCWTLALRCCAVGMGLELPVGRMEGCRLEFAFWVVIFYTFRLSKTPVGD